MSDKDLVISEMEELGRIRGSSEFYDAIVNGSMGNGCMSHTEIKAHYVIMADDFRWLVERARGYIEYRQEQGAPR